MDDDEQPQKKRSRWPLIALGVAVVNRRTLKLARSQYADGFASFLQVLTVQQQLLLAEQKEADSTTTVSTDLVALYKALGGWEITFPQEGD